MGAPRASGEAVLVQESLADQKLERSLFKLILSELQEALVSGSRVTC